MPSPEVARIFLWLAQYPWRAVTWFGAGHSIRWYHEPATFPLGGGNEGVLLLDDPGQLIGQEVPDLSGFTFGGEPVRWLWILPITERERQLAKERGATTVLALSTQSVGFFTNVVGFEEATKDVLPDARLRLYEESGRNAKVLLKQLV